MSDSISREAAENKLEKICNKYHQTYGEDYGCGFGFELYHAFDDLPTVTPAVKTGHWIELDECSNEGYYCSECHKRIVKIGWSDTVKKIKYCPNCGAKMVEPQESEEE